MKIRTERYKNSQKWQKSRKEEKTERKRERERERGRMEGIQPEKEVNRGTQVYIK